VKKKISICIPIHNQIKYVSELVESIKYNNNKKIDFIICDNKSTDGTYEFLLKNKKYFRLYRNNKNKGFIKNFIKTINKSYSEYITFMGGDDIFHSAKNLLNVCDEMKRNNISICFTPIYLFSTNIENKELYFLNKKRIFLNYKNSLIHNWLNSGLASIGGWVIKTKDLKKVDFNKIPKKSVFPEFHIGFDLFNNQKKISALFPKSFYIQRNGNNLKQLANAQYKSFKNYIEIYSIFKNITDKKILEKLEYQFIDVLVKNAPSIKAFSGDFSLFKQFIKKNNLNKKMTIFQLILVKIVDFLPFKIIKHLIFQRRKLKYKT